MNSLAASGSLSGNVTTFIQKVDGAIINPLIILMFAVGLVGFLWGVFTYITNAEDQEARAKGTQHMLWGVIGMGIMISAFAIVHIISATFGLNTGTTNTAVNSVIGGN